MDHNYKEIIIIIDGIITIIASSLSLLSLKVKLSRVLLKYCYIMLYYMLNNIPKYSVMGAVEVNSSRRWQMARSEGRRIVHLSLLVPPLRLAVGSILYRTRRVCSEEAPA